MKPERLRSGSDLEVVSEILVRIMYLLRDLQINLMMPYCSFNDNIFSLGR